MGTGDMKLERSFRETVETEQGGGGSARNDGPRAEIEQTDHQELPPGLRLAGRADAMGADPFQPASADEPADRPLAQPAPPRLGHGEHPELGGGHRRDVS
jgi:hypothetical protein